MTDTAIETVPEIVMAWKNFQCPMCYATIQAQVDLYAAHREEIPGEVEKHLEWHERNDRAL